MDGDIAYREIKRRLDEWEIFEKALRRIAREGQSDEGRSVTRIGLFGIQAKLIARDALASLKWRSEKEHPMPKIIELKEIDGAMWARVEVDLSVDPGSVSLVTGDEMDAIKRDVRMMCADLADDTVAVNRGTTEHAAGIRLGAKIVSKAIRDYK